MKGKKGSASDLAYLMGGILGLALVALLVTTVLNRFDTQVQASNIFPDNAKSASEKMTADFPATMDGGVVVVFFFMVFISLVLAALIPVHPMFLIFYLLEWLLLIYIGAGIADVYQLIIENPIFATEAQQYLFTTHFFRYFPYVVGIIGAVLAIVIYKAKEYFR